MTIERNFDVIVIGGGPAGSKAAYHLLKNSPQCKTAILERKEKIGDPVRCGEAIGLKGAELSVTLKKEWILSTINTIKIISPAQDIVELDISKNDVSYIVDRLKMDHDLLMDAINEGATYFNNTTVVDISLQDNEYTIRCHDQTVFKSKALIIADGVESRCAKLLNWDTTLKMEDIESCAFCHVEDESIVDNEAVELYTGNDVAPGGYLWVFPRRKGKANVGLGILGNRSRGAKAKGLLEKFIKRKYPNGTVDNFHCGGVPVGRWISPLYKDGALLVGDAASMVNSLNGGGIAYALYAGKIAGETMAEAYEENSVNWKKLKSYEKKWASYCGKQQARQYSLKNALQNKNNDDLYNTIARSLLKEKKEDLNYFRIFARTFSRHPILLFKTFLLFKK